MPENIQSERVEFRTSDGLTLAATRCTPAAESFAPPVLLLHGGGQTRHSWAGTGKSLAENGFTTYAVDQRGHGDSDWSEDGAYRFTDYARDCIDLSTALNTIHGSRPVLVGASMGGLAGIMAEGRIGPGALHCLILVDITPRMDEDGVRKILSFMKDRARDGFGTLQDAAQAIADYLPNRRRDVREAGLRKNLREGSDGRYYWHWDPKFVDTQLEAEKNGAVQDDLVAASRALSLPVALIRGQQSDIVRQDHADEFLADVPHVQYYDISDAGHMIVGDRNDVFTEAVTGFLGSIFDKESATEKAGPN